MPDRELRTPELHAPERNAYAQTILTGIYNELGSEDNSNRRSFTSFEDPDLEFRFLSGDYLTIVRKDPSHGEAFPLSEEAYFFTNGLLRRFIRRERITTEIGGNVMAQVADWDFNRIGGAADFGAAFVAQFVRKHFMHSKLARSRAEATSSN